MIITLSESATSSDIEAICKALSAGSYSASEVRTQFGRYLVAIGSSEIDIRSIGSLPGIKDVHRVSDSYKLVSKKWKVSPSTVKLGNGIEIAGGGFTIIAGPCSIESEEQVRSIAAHLKETGVSIMRGGAFKPRTSPYTFRGLGLEGLKMFHAIARDSGMKVISEVVATADIEAMYDYVDIYQVGTRNTQNFNLLHELGRIDKPVMIKRGMSGTLDELLQSAEYVFSNGNEALLLCERGIRTFEKAYRNTLDLNSVPVLKEKSHLPVIVDPSHGIGIRRFVEPMSLAAVMAGADGVIYEVHPAPEDALSDADQTLNFEESSVLVNRARQCAALRDGF
ncbi:MAG: bifunctional 3-deoxy-7-phosphoheptulonate synthase/chorismate mutase [Deltaproteobacteria bacterium]|nr:bifunctional 3-deoxy-7-phosphoheptulonate synthase/chorismate mutase [Deltaproteobacteria bacterium]